MTAAFWGRVLNRPLNKALGLQPIQCLVQGAAIDSAAGALIEFFDGGKRIRAVTGLEDGEKEELLEFAKVLGHHPRLFMRCRQCLYRDAVFVNIALAAVDTLDWRTSENSVLNEYVAKPFRATSGPSRKRREAAFKDPFHIELSKIRTPGRASQFFSLAIIAGQCARFSR